MKRFISVLAVAALMAVMLAAMVVPALARENFKQDGPIETRVGGSGYGGGGEGSGSGRLQVNDSSSDTQVDSGGGNDGRSGSGGRCTTTPTLNPDGTTTYTTVGTGNRC